MRTTVLLRAAVGWLFTVATCAAVAGQSPPALELMWDGRADTAPQMRVFDASGRTRADAAPTDPVPLGSLWKLFVYAYLEETGTAAPDYVCRAGKGDADRTLRDEELYCCDPGGSITRDAALVASCGPFFDPARLGVTPPQWRDFWQRFASAPDWLRDLDAMRPGTLVPTRTILHALDAVPKKGREAASRTLLSRVLDTPGDTRAASHLGGRLRIKTFSWFRPGTERRFGGGAGWLTDGTPVWFAGSGTGQQVMARNAALLDEALPLALSSLPPGCVEVKFFARYPLRHVQAPDGSKALPGPLRGRHVAVFEHGVSLPFLPNGEMTLVERAGRPVVMGRFGVDEYVARVVDREARADETEAARALAVVARSYLLEHAAQTGNCLSIDDSSHFQRVSPNPPSQAAREVAAFTTGLVLEGAPVGYHSERAGPNRMSWRDAVDRARQGQRWDAILRRTLPDAALAAVDDPAGIACERLPRVEAWLAEQTPRWRRALHELRGFEPPERFSVCRLKHGRPFAELDRGRIHVRGLRTQEDRLTLAHEYLHLGLRHHPSSTDEQLVENWARRLILGENRL